MKNICTLLAAVFLSLAAAAQNASTKGTRFPVLDKSPMDMAYFPSNYPVLKVQEKASEPLVARVIYSRPQRDGRDIFGELVEYGKLWRLGANEATEIEFYREVRLGSKTIPRGRYTLYAIPYENEWTIIVNRETDVWGSFIYDESKDVARLTVPVRKLYEVVDAFTMIFVRSAAGMDLQIAWEDITVSLPFALK